MDITQITPNLYVGSNPTRGDALQIARAGITHVVDVRGEPTANGPAEVPEPEIWAGTGVRYLNVPMRDNGTAIPAAKYATAVDAIDSAKRAGGVVLVYCAAGHSRSPAVAYADLRKTGLSPDAAWSLVARRRGADRQYIDDANRYLAGIGISGGGLVTGPGGATSTAPSSTGGKTPTTGPGGPVAPKTDGGSGAGVWLALAAIALGVVALVGRRQEVRHNPIDASRLPVSLRPFADKIADAYQEDEWIESGSRSAWWVHTAPGWCYEPGSHTIHEPTLKGVVQKLRSLEPCTCEECLASRPTARRNPTGELRANRAVYRATYRAGRLVDILRVNKLEGGYVQEFVWYMAPGTTKLPTRAGSDYGPDRPVPMPDYFAAERLFNEMRGF